MTPIQIIIYIITLLIALLIGYLIGEATATKILNEETENNRKEYVEFDLDEPEPEEQEIIS